MRIYVLLVFVISISIATAKKESSKNSTVKAVTTKTSRTAKSLGENRGKRTLNKLGYPGFSYSLDFANRRQGYSDARAFYSPPDGIFNGQSAIGQYSLPDTSNHLPDYSQFSQYPQYFEAPEPIIEIIIKDSNETVPTQPPQPIVQKKKKEKVHVYYVKYKKDENNKLQLDEPIASLSENEASTDESEEIVHYPSIVTPLPPVKTTTLRTVIHPDSEKFHSNSGIHVTFGSEDKSQSGHELQEHNAESIQRSVVALPQAGNFNSGPSPTANVRADFSSPRGATGETYQNYQGSFYQNQNQNSQREYKPAIQQQQLPEAQALTSFRPQLPLQHQTQPQHQNQQQQQQLPQIHQNFQNFQQNQQQPPQQLQQQQQQHYEHQQQQQHHQQQQRPFYNQGPANPPPSPPKQQYQRPPATTPAPPSPPAQYQNYQQQNVYQQQQKQYYQFSQQPKQHPVPSAHPQQYQQQQQHHHHPQQQQQQYQQRPSAPAQKQSVFFPTPPPKSQDLPARPPSSTSYQPVKFRPTPVPSVQKLESPNRAPLAQAQQYNRPPAYVQQPTYSTLPQSHVPQYETVNRYQKPQSQKRPEQSYNQQQQQQQQQFSFNQKQQHSQSNSFGQSQSPSLGQLHSLFDVRPSKETELLKAIPKFEQHITETVSGNRYNNYQTYSGGNQVIHDIPAPNLGPTTPTSGHSSNSGQYNSGPSNHHQQFNNFVTSPNPIQYQSSTQAPQYVKSEDGQQIQIVTPMPSSSFYNHQGQVQSQFISSGSGAQPQIIPNSQPKQQAFYNNQQPRQSESSQFSVSTLHSDVFKELEHRKNTLGNDNINIQSKQNFKNFVTKPEQKKTTPTTTTSAPSSTTSKNAAKNSLQLPDEVPDDLRQQLLSSGILDNADISVLDYDKVGDVNLENLPAEHLQHFYGAGGGAQISESNKVLTVVKPNGDSVDFSQKNINRIKESTSLPRKQNVDLKVVHFNANNERNVTDKHIKTDSTVVPSIDLADKQYNRYLPLKINGAQFPIPDVEELQGKKIASVVVLAPVDNLQGLENERSDDERIERDTTDSKEVKFVTGDIIKQLIKKPTKENFKKWLEKESRTDVESQSVVLLVAKSSSDDQEIFMYDIATGAVNKLNGELSSAFVNVAEENASAENLDHASTLDPSILENMMEKMKKV